MEVKAFLSAALPPVLAGIALAVLAASCGTRERRSRVSGGSIAAGAGLGLLLGVALNGCGLWENHVLGWALGPLWGMALGSLFGRDGRSDTAEEGREGNGSRDQFPKP